MSCSKSIKERGLGYEMRRTIEGHSITFIETTALSVMIMTEPAKRRLSMDCQQHGFSQTGSCQPQ
jgi:hypothetical protein